jgi:hypothetical protein
MTEAPRVTIAGGGLAGLTAALRLAERGYRVKLYEQKSMLGGNLASRTAADGTHLDVYPHMYLGWYHNFWQLLKDVTDLDRDELFTSFSTIKQLRRRGESPRYTGLTDMYSAWRMLPNLFSGVGAPADMLVFGYASVDLLAERCQSTVNMDNLSVGGFLDARPYMTKPASEAYNSFITTVWAIPSYMASAGDYRSYLDYCLAEPRPAFWLARGSALHQVISYLTAALEAADVEIVRSVQVTGVVCRGGRVSEISLQKTEPRPKSNSWAGVGDRWTEEIEELILAVPPVALSQLVRAGKAGSRIVESAPRTAELSHLHTVRIPMLHLYFTKKMRDIPPQPVALFESSLALAFTDISQTWDDTAKFGDRTVLALSASEPHGLPRTGDHADAMAMLRQLAEYLDFEPGTEWGKSEDIDWDLTRYDANDDAQLFVNEAGTDAWRPTAPCAGLSNLYFAGDFCNSRVGMTTIESAVTAGLEAARDLVQRRGIGDPVGILEPHSRPGSLYVWLRYAWAPYAYAASTWSKGERCVRGIARKLKPLCQ